MSRNLSSETKTILWNYLPEKYITSTCLLSRELYGKIILKLLYWKSHSIHIEERFGYNLRLEYRMCDSGHTGNWPSLPAFLRAYMSSFSVVVLQDSQSFEVKGERGVGPVELKRQKGGQREGWGQEQELPKVHASCCCNPLQRTTWADRSRDFTRNLLPVRLITCLAIVR